LSFRARGRGQQVRAWACSAHRRGGESLPSGAVPGAETKEISAYASEHVISARPIAQRRAVPRPFAPSVLPMEGRIEGLGHPAFKIEKDRLATEVSG